MRAKQGARRRQARAPRRPRMYEPAGRTQRMSHYCPAVLARCQNEPQRLCGRAPHLPQAAQVVKLGCAPASAKKAGVTCRHAGRRAKPSVVSRSAVASVARRATSRHAATVACPGPAQARTGRGAAAGARRCRVPPHNTALLRCRQRMACRPRPELRGAAGARTNEPAPVVQPCNASGKQRGAFLFVAHVVPLLRGAGTGTYRATPPSGLPLACRRTSTPRSRRPRRTPVHCVPSPCCCRAMTNNCHT